MLAALLFLLGSALIVAGIPTDGPPGDTLCLLGLALVWAAFFRTIRKVPPQ
jgi:hypothetical protein